MKRCRCWPAVLGGRWSRPGRDRPARPSGKARLPVPREVEESRLTIPQWGQVRCRCRLGGRGRRRRQQGDSQAAGVIGCRHGDRRGRAGSYRVRSRNNAPPETSRPPGAGAPACTATESAGRRPRLHQWPSVSSTGTARISRLVAPSGTRLASHARRDGHRTISPRGRTAPPALAIRRRRHQADRTQRQVQDADRVRLRRQCQRVPTGRQCPDCLRPAVAHRVHDPPSTW